MKRERIVILTGAGISAESGLSTFRDKGGIWATHDWRELATPEGYARDPVRVHDFYDMRRARIREALPNAAHLALARLQEEHPGEVKIVTQNVDDLHEKAGAQGVIHMHGAHATALCAACGHRWPAPERLAHRAPCPDCRAPAARPDVVWFGERPYHMEAIRALVAGATLFAAIGTSGVVQPAAGLVRHARAAGAATVEINLEPTARAALFDAGHYGPASETVPRWVEAVLAGAGVPAPPRT